MEAEFGVNSPEFLQKKIDRLKTALDEANVLMDRHVTERDEARAQIDALRRENEGLKEQLASGAPASGSAEPPPADRGLENELRARIAVLEGELRAASIPTGGDDQGLRDRIAALEGELGGARQAAESAGREAESARRDADAARRDVDA